MGKPNPNIDWEEKNSRIVILSGKHHDEFLDEVPDKYLKWCVQQFVEQGWFDENLIVEMEKELKFREKHGTPVDD
jgi:hypothetical protein